MSKTDSKEWVSLRQASEILGVHPATVRNWADSGKLSYRRTPGGHRRFHMNELRQRRPSQSEIRPVELEMIFYNATGRAYIGQGAEALHKREGWYADLSEERKMRYRELGFCVLEAIREHIMAGAPQEGLSVAMEIGKQYAANLIEDGLGLTQAIGGYFYFYDIVLTAINDFGAIAPADTSGEISALLRQINNFTNTMLLSVVEYYEAE